MNKKKAIEIGENIKTVLFQKKFSHILPDMFYQNKPFDFDLSINNKKVSSLNMSTPIPFIKYINNTLLKSNHIWGLGGYGEKRDFYQASSNFINKEEARNIHLGLDIWIPARTDIFCPLQGTVHSFQDNNKFLDYGPTIILEHKIENIIFYTLYGHLERESLNAIEKGMQINAGQKIAMVGCETENGSWPSHLHFQIIGDLLGNEGDFPGVSSTKEKEIYLNLCPDPKIIFSS